MDPYTWMWQCWPTSLELIYVSSVRTQDAIWKTCRERWMIRTDEERERERENQGNSFYQRELMMMMMIYIHHHHHHHVALVARISLTFSRHSFLSFITPGRSSGQHPVSSHSCWMYVRAGRPAFARPCVGVHKSRSLMSSSLLLQQCPACLVRLTWIVFVIGGRWPYSWCLVGCCRQDLFKIARSILV